MCATQLQAFCVSLDRSSSSRLTRIRHWLTSVVAICTLSLSLCLASASAQVVENDDGLPSAILFATTVQRGRHVPELDKQIRKAVVEHAPVHLRDAPPKKLSALQASARCRDESVPCMRAVARVAGVEVLLAATLERGSGELTLSFMAFDARADAVTRVAHWQDGSDVTAETYAALPSLLASLFPEPGPPDMDFVAEANATTEKKPAEQRSIVSTTDAAPAPPSLLAPVLVAGGGALLLGAGVVTGLMLNSTQGDYSDRQVVTRSDAEGAEALRSRASTQASLANVFYGLGSVALVASGAWLAIELWGGGKREQSAPTTTLSPWLSPREVGLVLRHQGGAL
jgi:hypothetical protein